MEIEDGDAAKLMMEDAGLKQDLSIIFQVLSHSVHCLKSFPEYAAHDADTAPAATAHRYPCDQVWQFLSQYIWTIVIWRVCFPG
jgi:hypothetical protein